MPEIRVQTLLLMIVIQGTIMSTAISMAGPDAPATTSPAGAARASAQNLVPANNGADILYPVDLRKVRLGGELGRRMGITIEGNLLKLNPDQHIKPFVTKNTRGAEPFIGTGKTLDGMVRLAANTGNPALIAAAGPVPGLKRLVLLPATAELVPEDKSIRPDGTACRIRADLDKADKGAYTLTLTEFPDPDGQWTYFHLADPKAAVEDELMTGAK